MKPFTIDNTRGRTHKNPRTISGYARAFLMITDTQLSAPMAGVGIGRAMFAKLLSRDDLADLLAAAALDGLQAMTPRRWDPGAQEWISDPDYRVRTQTLFALLAQAEGEPIKRSVKQIISTESSPQDISKELADNPAARAAMRRILEQSETEARKIARQEMRAAKTGSKPAGAEVIDVD